MATDSENTLWAIRDCGCNQDHAVMPTDVDGTELVCRVHKRHRPCRKCMYSGGKVAAAFHPFEVDS